MRNDFASNGMERVKASAGGTWQRPKSGAPDSDLNLACCLLKYTVLLDRAMDGISEAFTDESSIGKSENGRPWTGVPEYWSPGTEEHGYLCTVCLIPPGEDPSSRCAFRQHFQVDRGS